MSFPNILNKPMDEEILGGDEDFEMLDESSTPLTQDDLFFNSIVMALQEIVVDPRFESNQAGFMRNYCEIFEPTEENKNEYIQIFHQYQANISKCLEEMLQELIGTFDMAKFNELLPSRTHQIDEEIYEILTSFTDFQTFKALMLDYKASKEEEERYRVMTIKTNKVPEHKKVKGASDNIFGGAKPPTFGDPLKKKNSGAGKKIEKSEQQILVPDLVLTVRPLRKS